LVGKFLWPGFGDNARVLEWIIERATSDNGAIAQESPIGYVPTPDAINISGLKLDKSVMDELLTVDTKAWQKEAASYEEFITQLGDCVPTGITAQLKKLKQRLGM
jgi:phosphoenolpyruvate carboxykinase (GTP)